MSALILTPVDNFLNFVPLVGHLNPFRHFVFGHLLLFQIVLPPYHEKPLLNLLGLVKCLFILDILETPFAYKFIRLCSHLLVLPPQGFLLLS